MLNQRLKDPDLYTSNEMRPATLAKATKKSRRQGNRGLLIFTSSSYKHTDEIFMRTFATYNSCGLEVLALSFTVNATLIEAQIRVPSVLRTTWKTQLRTGTKEAVRLHLAEKSFTQCQSSKKKARSHAHLAGGDAIVVAGAAAVTLRCQLLVCDAEGANRLPHQRPIHTPAHSVPVLHQMRQQQTGQRGTNTVKLGEKCAPTLKSQNKFDPKPGAFQNFFRENIGTKRQRKNVLFFAATVPPTPLSSSSTR